jgi:hypothetical protein
VNLADATDEMKRLNDLLDAGLKTMREQSGEYAEAEMEYRQAKATAWLSAPQGTVPEREAFVNGNTAEKRKRRDLADGLRQSAYAAVRARQQQISALQSLLSAEKAEMELAR